MQKQHLLVIPAIVILASLLAIFSSEGLFAQGDEGPPKPVSEIDLSLNDRYLSMGHETGLSPEIKEETSEIFLYSMLTFMSIRDNNWEIYTAKGNGSNLKRVTFHSAADYQPRFNRGASRIAFASNRDGNWEIYTMNRTGGDIRRLTNNGAIDANPSWSYDGSKIVFESNRDGQYEIYSMNADGSNQTRLTHHGAYDIDPYWSPDGSKIVFSSGRNNDGIWVMNADGSNPQQLVAKRYSENPVWSPDGSRIAFDADGNGDSWQEIWVMDADGSNQKRLYAPSGQVDPYVRSWSPDSRYIAFTRSEWIHYKGNWYWTRATPYYHDTQGNYTTSFNYSLDREWYPDWQATDITPPTSAITPLPAYSRHEAHVSWSGSDPAGSGLATYDVQYRIGQDGPWQDWYIDTTATSGIFGKLPGKTIYFRCRAVDRAGNQADWPIGDGDTHTTFYNWKITGQAVDNRLVPLPGVTVTTTQQVFEITPSDEDGYFGAYFDGYESFFNIGFFKHSYDPLPTTQFSAANDGTLDIRLPPADNILVDPNFEADGAPAGSWQVGGLISPVITTTQRHTGQQAVYFGQAFDLEIIAQFDAEIVFNSQAKPRHDGNGRFHAVWHEAATNSERVIYYAYGDQDGTWSEPLAPMPFNTGIDDFYWDVTPDGRVHIIWRDAQNSYDMLYHAWLDGGGWHGPNIVYNIGRARLYSFRLDNQGNGHMLWHLSGTGIEDFFYCYVNQSGIWSSPERLFVQGEYEPYNIVIDHNDVVHLQWNYSGDDLFHNYRLPDGSWSTLEKVAPGGYNWYNDLIIDDLNGVHMVWGNVSNGKIFHSKRHSDGSWSSPTILSEGTQPDVESFQAVPGTQGRLTIVWQGGEGFCSQPYLVEIDPSGFWTGQTKIDPGTECTSNLWLQRLSQQIILYTDHVQDEYHHFCQVNLVSGANANPGECARLPRVTYGWQSPLPIMGMDGGSHVFWRNDQSFIHSRSAVSETDSQSRLYQTVTIPAEMLNPTLSFAYLQGYNGGDEQLGLQVSVADNLGSTQIFSGTQTAGWAYQWLDLAPWSGQQITLTYSLRQKAGQVFASAYLDEAFLGSAYPDAWTAIEAEPDVAPGELLGLILHYGNKSSAPAENSQLTLTLPPGLAYLSAVPAPATQVGQTVTWDVGTLTASDGIGAISVSTEVSQTVPSGTVLPISILLTSSTPELNEDNNSHQVVIVFANRVFLPLVVRP